ncbi:FtsK/SpoIIIE domain-containing protein [Cryobacterium sp. W22_MBD10_FK3]|uniref:FtsK/SpoIIIE domain-containing protein n=1 Tax=Cryobacterium sp. W22_MBD10_FK3 TaxID=3240273 RepID=UPI003F8DB8B8
MEILSGPDAGEVYSLCRGIEIIGRGPDSDIVLTDRTVSKSHARFHVSADKIELVDLNSANGILVQGEPVRRLELHHGQEVMIGETLIRATLLVAAPSQAITPVQGMLLTRSPRVEPRYVGEDLDGVDLPTPAEPQPFPWLAMAAPLILGGVLFSVTQQLLSVVFVAMSPVLMFGTWLTSRMTKKRKMKMDKERFSTQLDRLDTRLTSERETEIATRLGETPALHQIYQHAISAGTLVWTRRLEHWSFLHLRLGMGVQPSRNKVTQPNNRDAAIPEYLESFESLAESFRDIPDLPVIESLAEAGALGITGSHQEVADYVRGVIAQVAGLHASSDVLLVGLLDAVWAGELADLKWLPHTWEVEPVIGTTALADSPPAAMNLIARLEDLIAARSPGNSTEPARLGALKEEEAARLAGGRVGVDGRSDGGAAAPTPAVVMVIADHAPADRARLIQVVERAAQRGIYPIWIAERPELLPAACRTFVEVSSPTTARVNFVRQGTEALELSVEGLTRQQFSHFARSLARLTDASVVEEDASDVPRTIPLLHLLGKEMALSSLSVRDRWEQNGSILREGQAISPKYQPKLRALVGQSASGAMQIDLRTQGPHALVGGTTGSGKSEFLQAWVLGMASEYSPQRVTFLFVDYKGGSAFADCIQLPHCVGLVTDLSPHLVRRALVSLRAELHYRETLLNRKKAKDILELEKRGDPDTPPALVLVIDEFAALVSEVPAFVDGVVDIAQRGRSLGIHLIMATQRPAGVIKDNLRANTNLRVALRMADELDSDDVVGTKEAALFDPSIPGRALAKTGPGRLTVFQSAYAGGWSLADVDDAEVTVKTFGIGNSSVWEVPEDLRPPRREASELGPNDQQMLVARMGEASAGLGIPAPRRPWLDELAPIVDQLDLMQLSDRELLLGMKDVPERQMQVPVSFDPDAEGHLAVFGTGGAGKSGTLRALAIAARQTVGGEPVHVYGLEFGSGGLRMLESLPHVGSIIPGDDSERIMRLFRMLRSELDRRSEAYAAVTADTITEYRRLAMLADEPRLLLLIDGFPAFRNEYEGIPGRAEAYQILQQIISDGRSVGVHIALSADRGQSLPSALNAMIQRRIVLRMADSDAYVMLDVPRDVLSSDSRPGRAVIDRGEAQIAVIAGTGNSKEQSRAVDDLAARLRAEGRTEAPPIRSLPALFSADALPAEVGGQPTIGLSDIDLGPIAIEPSGVFLVAGPPQSGRSNAVAAIVAAVARSRPDTRLVYIGTRKSPVLASRAWSDVATDASTAMTMLSGIIADGHQGDNDLLIVVEGISDYANSMAESLLSDIVRRARRGEGMVLIEGETNDWGSSFGLVGDIKSARRGVVLQPDTHDGELILKTAFPRLAKSEFPQGRAMLVQGGRVARIQFPLAFSPPIRG